MSSKRNRILLAIVCMLLACEVLWLWLAARVGYGYNRYADKNFLELFLIRLEYVVDGLVVCVLLISTYLIPTGRELGRWFYLVLAWPLILMLWWSLQIDFSVLLETYRYAILPALGIVLFLRTRSTDSVDVTIPESIE